eukprot:4793395-Amphidinium_carterae.1
MDEEEDAFMEFEETEGVRTTTKKKSSKTRKDPSPPLEDDDDDDEDEEPESTPFVDPMLAKAMGVGKSSNEKDRSAPESKDKKS